MYSSVVIRTFVTGNGFSLFVEYPMTADGKTGVFVQGVVSGIRLVPIVVSTMVEMNPCDDVARDGVYTTVMRRVDVDLTVETKRLEGIDVEVMQIRVDVEVTVARPPTATEWKFEQEAIINRARKFATLWH
jgi:hypothetical protein